MDWFTAILIASGALCVVVIFNVNRKNFTMKDPRSPMRFHGYAKNLNQNGGLRKRVILLHHGFVATSALPIVVWSVRILSKVFRSWSNYSILCVFPPGFGGTTHLEKMYQDRTIERGRFYLYALPEARALQAQGVTHVICIGLSMGANSIAKVASVLSAGNRTKIEAVITFEGLFEKMSPERLKSRFVDPVGAFIKRLRLKFGFGRKMIVRLTNRGNIRMLAMEILPMFLPWKKRAIDAYNRMLAETTLKQDLQVLASRGVPILVVYADESTLTRREIYAEVRELGSSKAPFQVMEVSDTHLGLTNDPWKFSRIAARFAREILIMGKTRI